MPSRLSCSPVRSTTRTVVCACICSSSCSTSMATTSHAGSLQKATQAQPRAASLAHISPLQLSPALSLWPPLLAAPMAGISCAPYRQLCTAHGASLATSEMVIASALLLRNRRTLKLAEFAPDEAIRSVQLYGVRPDQVKQAVRMLVLECGVHHVDLNFGCPVRKITARGGGSALPLRPQLFARLVAAAVAGARGLVPVTVKMRVGLTADMATHIQAGRIAEAEGAAAITLHARTADQLYSPPVQWAAVRELVNTVRIPVIGNGDVYDAEHAVRLLVETGCAGVMVGRAALGRPWVFGEVAAALRSHAASQGAGSGGCGGYPTEGRGKGAQEAVGGLRGRPSCSLPPSPVGPPLAPLGGPALGAVVDTAVRHCEAQVAWYRDYDEGERESLLRFRKFVPLYLYGFESAVELKARLMAATSLHQWRAAAYDTSLYDAAEPYPACAIRHPRLKGGGGAVRQRMGLPDGWLDELGGGGSLAERLLTDEASEG